MARSLMLVHGMCCTGEVWTNFRRFYEERGLQVFTPTLRPNERVRSNPSPALRALRLANYISDLEQRVAQIEADTGSRPTIIGHSMGGLLAQALAERNCVSAAVLISPSPPAGVRDWRMRLFWGGLLAARTLGLVPRALYPFRRITNRLVFNQVPNEERHSAHAAMVQESRAVFADFRTHHIDETKIKIPMLTIAARRDRLVPARLTRRAAKKYAAVGGEFVEYPEHGHWLYAEPGWEKPAAEILGWVEANTPG
jgi:pimeloyl-ACP methyl ester carboxylesterase